MTLTAQQLLNMRPSLAKLANNDLPALIAYKLARLIKKLDEEIEPIEKARLEAFKKYGEAKGDMISVPDENREALMSELIPLLESSIEVDVSKLKIESIQNANISAADLLALEPIIEE